VVRRVSARGCARCLPLFLVQALRQQRRGDRLRGARVGALLRAAVHTRRVHLRAGIS